MRVPRSHSILPSSDSDSPSRIESRVVLPAPLGPTSPIFSRASGAGKPPERELGPKRLLRFERVSMSWQTGLRIGGFWQRNSMARRICLFLTGRCH